MSRNVLTRNSVITALFFCTVFIYYFAEVKYHLVFKEQVIMFLFDSSYISSLLHHPAFAVQLAGDFLTQFFLVHWLAPIISLLSIIVFWLGFRRILSILDINNTAIWALVPTSAEAALQTQFEYPLAMSLGAAGAVWAVLIYSKIAPKWLRHTIVLLLAAAAYPIVGAYALFFFALTITVELHNMQTNVRERCDLPGCGSKSNIYIWLTILSMVFLVSVYCECLHYQMTWPDFISYPVIPGYNIRYTHLFLFVPALAIISMILGKKEVNAYCVASLAFAVLVAGAAFFHDSQREYDLKISTLAYRNQWTEVEKLAQSNEFESQTGAFYRNLTNAKKGILAHELLNGYQPLIFGLFMPVNGDESYIKIFASIDAMLHCKDYAQAQHAAIVGMNFSPRQTSSRMTRALAEIAVINRDTLAAQRYCSMLKKTLFFRNWAAEAESLMYESNGMEMNVTADTIFKVNDFQNSLRNILSCNPANESALHYLLCFDLLQKNLVEFINDYDRFYMPHFRNIVPPVVYQQALEMMEAGADYKISREVEQANQDFLSGNEAKYKKSYWFYFKYAQAAE